MVIQTVMSTAKAMVMDWRFPRLREKAKDWLRKRGMARDWLILMLTAIQMAKLTDLRTARDSLIPRLTGFPMEKLRATEKETDWLIRSWMAIQTVTERGEG